MEDEEREHLEHISNSIVLIAETLLKDYESLRKQCTEAEEIKEALNTKLQQEMERAEAESYHQTK